jgi:hypothetical protein
MAWKNLKLSVPVPKGGLLQRLASREPPEMKTILHTMQGEARPGEFLVIMGPRSSTSS